MPFFSFRFLSIVLISAALQILLAVSPHAVGSGQVAAYGVYPGSVVHALMLPFLLALMVPFLMAARRMTQGVAPGMGGGGAAGPGGLLAETPTTRRVSEKRTHMVTLGQALLFVIASVGIGSILQYLLFSAKAQLPGFALTALSFGVAVTAFFLLLRAFGIPLPLVQVLASLAALLVLATPFYADLLCSFFSEEQRRGVVDMLVKVNPMLTLSAGVFGLDLFRQPVMYSFSQVGSTVPYRNATWSELAVWYSACAAAMLGVAQGVLRLRIRRRR